jgi:two-component system nitrogen regulation sensor histidine kinase GlnL
MTDITASYSETQGTMETTDLNGSAILNALPDPVLVVGSDDRILYANNAAEQLFRASCAYMRERTLSDLIPHDSPVLLLVERVRRGESSMSQHGVRLETPRTGEHLVRVDGAPMAGQTGPVVLTLKEQSIAGKIDRSLTHRD